MGLSPAEIPQRLIQQLFELDADYAEALWALDQPRHSLDWQAMLRDTLASLEQLPTASMRFRKHLPRRAHPTLESLEVSIRKKLDPREAYNMVPGNPKTVKHPSVSGMLTIRGATGHNSLSSALPPILVWHARRGATENEHDGG